MNLRRLSCDEKSQRDHVSDKLTFVPQFLAFLSHSAAAFINPRREKCFCHPPHSFAPNGERVGAKSRRKQFLMSKRANPFQVCATDKNKFQLI